MKVKITQAKSLDELTDLVKDCLQSIEASLCKASDNVSKLSILLDHDETLESFLFLLDQVRKELTETDELAADSMAIINGLINLKKEPAPPPPPIVGPEVQEEIPPPQTQEPKTPDTASRRFNPQTRMLEEVEEEEAKDDKSL